MHLRVLAVLCGLISLTAAEEIPGCYNRNFEFRPTDWNDALERDTSARLYLSRVWTSKQPPKLPVTVVTHGAIQRDKHMHQCRTWAGPIVAAMYLPLVQDSGTELSTTHQQTVKAAEQHLSRLHSRLEKNGKCQLTLMLFWEVFSNANDSWLYPTNDLRNLALTQARTPMVAMIDIDLMINIGLSNELADAQKAAEVQQITSNKGVVALAAFQTPSKMKMLPGRRVVEQLVRGSKEGVVRMLQEKGPLIPFGQDVFAPGHNWTDYPRWSTVTEAYEVEYKWHYEPWYIIDRRTNPFYDIRFRAYFYNKVMHCAHIASIGTKYFIHPTAYIIHRPHPVSKVYSSQQIFDELHHNMWLKSESAKKLMHKQQYEPLVDPTSLLCVKELPWWTDPNYSWQDPANWGSTAFPDQGQGQMS